MIASLDVNPMTTTTASSEKPAERTDWSRMLVFIFVPVLFTLLGLVAILRRMRFKESVSSSSSSAADPEDGMIVRRNISARNPHYFLNPSKWCVTPEQLLVLLEEVEKRYPNEDPKVYTVVKEIIKPRTQDSDESYALLLNPQGVPVKHFITHAWAEGFKQFARDLLKLNLSGGLWICFLANPQTWHADDLDQLLGANAWMSPFAVALSEADTVIAVRNPNLNMYTRLWCVFELYLAYTRGKRVEVVGPQAPRLAGEAVGYGAACSVTRDTKRLRAAMQHCADDVNAWTQMMMFS